jgi:hypothetical protein
MTIFITIIGFVISIIGLYKKIKGATITFIIWTLSLVYAAISMLFRGNYIIILILSCIILVFQTIWIIIVNKKYEGGVK